MSEKININQVEKITGVSKRNIRFYEQEGLLLPTRNPIPKSWREMKCFPRLWT